MMGFEGLEVYQKVRKLTVEVLYFIDRQINIDLFIKDQLKRAALSILLNIAEGSGRISVADKKHFLMIARGSLYETLALLTVLHDMGRVNDGLFTDFYHRYEDCAKMLFGLYTKMKPFSENH